LDRYPDPEAFSVGVMYEQLRKRLQLEDMTDTWGYDRMVVSPDISRPGLCLSGYTYKFMHDRIQIFGETEITLLNQLSPLERQAAVKTVFSFPVVCSIVTKGLSPPEELVSASRSSGSALFVSPLDTTPLIHDLTDFFSEVFAPHVSLHGTLVDVYGEGLLVMGRSAIGKSEKNRQSSDWFRGCNAWISYGDKRNWICEHCRTVWCRFDQGDAVGGSCGQVV